MTPDFTAQCKEDFRGRREALHTCAGIETVSSRLKPHYKKGPLLVSSPTPTRPVDPAHGGANDEALSPEQPANGWNAYDVWRARVLVPQQAARSKPKQE